MNKKPVNRNVSFYSPESIRKEHSASQILDDVNDTVKRRFQKKVNFDSFYLHLHSKQRFMASVLFDSNDVIEASKRSGDVQELREFVQNELEKKGFGSRDGFEVQFTLDSQEVIHAKNDGNTIPSDDDFARAEKMMAERDQNLGLVSQNVMRKFSNRTSFIKVHLLWQDDVDFRAYIFFESNSDIERHRVNGDCQEIIDFTYRELESAGRGKRSDIVVAFEFDSDENVTENFEGDYTLRLR